MKARFLSFVLMVIWVLLLPSNAGSTEIRRPAQTPVADRYRMQADPYSGRVMLIENAGLFAGDTDFHSAFVGTSVGVAQSPTQNLIVNGNFESGYMGFYSSYSLSPGNLWPEGVYDVLSNPHNAHGHAASFGDHTGSSGLMMAINGARWAGVTVWSQTINVMQTTDYIFSAWIASWTSTSPAQLQFQMNDSIVGIFTAPSIPGIWQEFTTTWNSGSNTSVTIRIIDLNTSWLGNDFALDDLSFVVAGGPSLSISHIEVTQATQDENNSVPLIADKPTFVRVYVSCPPDGEVPQNAAIALRGFGPSGELGAPLAPFGGYLRTACRESFEAQRADLRKTLNFYLPTEWTQGEIKLRAEVGNAIWEEPFKFWPSRTVRVRYVPIHYDPSPLCIWLNKDPDSARIAKAYQWTQKVYPTAKIEYLPWPKMDWGQPLRKLACLGKADLEAEKVLNFYLSLQWFLAEGSRPDYVFGWLPDNAVDGGMADPQWPDWPGIGLAAHGDDDPTHGPRVFAHEIGHLLGRRHTRATSDPRPECANLDATQYNNWPYPTAGIQQHGVDIDVIDGNIRLQHPSVTYDYMSYCWYTPYDLPAWTSPYTYQQIYSQTLRIKAIDLDVQSLSTPQPYFITNGLVYADGTAILTPIWVITSTTAPENPPAGTQYCLEAQDASGAVLAGHCFDLNFLNYETGEATSVDGFNLMLPYPNGVARIVLRKGSQVLAIQLVSAHAPVVNVLSPNGGETWTATGTYTITWTASDPDGDPLTYSVLYSSDGNEWLPVGMGITQTQWVVDAVELAGGDDARVRVLASDGVNTSSDESDASFTVGRKTPQAFILSPAESITITVGTPLWLQGYAYDLEDGVLDDADLHWSSDQDGDLGTEGTVLANLSPGRHTITFIVTDSDGNQVTAMAQILVAFPEDLVPDCRVDAADLQLIADRWCQDADPRFDLDGDGDVDVIDVMRVARMWGQVCP